MKQVLELGKEYPIKGEDKFIFDLVRDLIADVEHLYGPGETQRQAHPKQHALLKGEFAIESNLPPNLKVGVFKHDRTYPCWIRYSSSNTKVQADKKGDVRGMAIKLLDVPGHKLLTDQMHSDNQDFLLVSMPTFPTKDVHEFQRFLHIITQGRFGKLLLPSNWDLLRTAMRFKKRFVVPSNLLQIPYWSTVPYQFGDLDRAVKYHVRPQSDTVDQMPKKPSPWYLREAIIRTLKQDLFCSTLWFNFRRMRRKCR